MGNRKTDVCCGASKPALEDIGELSRMPTGSSVPDSENSSQYGSESRLLMTLKAPKASAAMRRLKAETALVRGYSDPIGDCSGPRQPAVCSADASNKTPAKIAPLRRTFALYGEAFSRISRCVPIESGESH